MDKQIDRADTDIKDKREKTKQKEKKKVIQH